MRIYSLGSVSSPPAILESVAGAGVLATPQLQLLFWPGKWNIIIITIGCLQLLPPQSVMVHWKPTSVHHQLVEKSIWRV